MKTLDFPVKAFILKKKDLHFVLDGLETIINAFIKDFGQSAQFHLKIELTYLPKPKRTPK